LALIAPAIPITVGPIAIAVRSIGPIARIARTTIRCPMAAATGASIRAADTANLFDERIAIRERQVSHARDHRRFGFPDYPVTSHEYGGCPEGGEQFTHGSSCTHALGWADGTVYGVPRHCHPNLELNRSETRSSARMAALFVGHGSSR
jgi:hypothetical protein